MKQPKVIIVYSPYQPFVLQCICAIIQEAGYTMAVIESGKPPEGEFDFMVIESKEFSREDEMDCHLVFTSYHDSFDDMKWLKNLVKWMRSQKHAYCMNPEEHPQGLHNYNNFRNFIMPLTFMFKKDGYDFTKCNPSKLIEKLRPQEEKIKMAENEQKK